MTSLDELRKAMSPRPVRIRVRDLAPAVLVVVLACTSAEPDACQSTDGPQFACYLRDHS